MNTISIWITATCVNIILFLITAFFLKTNLTGKFKKDLEETREAAQKADQAKDEFLANMSHEIRTPINAILGMNEMILRDAGDPEVLSYARNIEHAGESLLSLVNDILDFSKIGSGKMTIINDEYSLSDLIKGVEALIRPRAEQKGLKFTIKANPKIPDQLKGDKLRVEQIINNLLTNAVKYTDKGSITLELDWRRIDNGKMALKISVSDTGRGIKKEDIETLFTKFQRLDLGENNTIEGTGLGLTITKTLVELMAGWIHVDSTYGKGSTFTVFITQTVICEEEIGDLSLKTIKREKDRTSGIVAPDARILIVDDTPLNLEVAVGLLKGTQINVDTAGGGSECIELAKNNSYDMIFLDARMPHPDGIETLKKLRNENIQYPVIVLTANAVNGAREQYLEEGFDEYLAKPFRLKELEDMITKFLPPEMIGHIEIRNENKALPKWITNIPELDPTKGLEMCGDAEIYIETLKRFVKYSAEEIPLLGKYAHEDIKNFTIKVHALKSTARVIGAERLANMALQLEEAGSRSDAEYIENNIDEALSSYGALVSALMPINTREEDSGPKEEIVPGQVPMIFNHLREYVEEFNDEAVGSMLKALSKYSFPGQSQKIFNELNEAFEAADWTNMQEILRRRNSA